MKQHTAAKHTNTIPACGRLLKAVFLMCVLGLAFLPQLFAQQTFLPKQEFFPAQEDVFPARFFPISSNEGLSQGYVPSIIQDHRGFIWFATKDGLNRYDGYSFTVYRHDPDNAYSISDNFIIAIFEDSRGYIWLSLPTGIDVFDPVTERFFPVRFNLKDGKPGGLDDLREDGYGNIWGRTYNGWYCLRMKLGDQSATEFRDKFNIEVLAAEKMLKLPADGPREIYFEKNGDLWAIQGEDVLHYAKKDQPNAAVTKKYAQGEFSGFPGAMIYQFYEDTLRNSLVLISSKGVAVYNKSAKKLESVCPRNTAIFHLPKATAIDNKGQVWMSLDDDLYIYDRKAVKIKRTEPRNIDAQAWDSYSVKSTLVDRGGIVWMGTNGYGVFKYNPRVASFNMFERRSITSISDDREGRIYMGTPEGLFYFDLQNLKMGGKAFPEKALYPVMDGIQMGPRAFVQDEKGIFWMNYGSGWIVRYDEKKKDVKFFQVSIPSETENFTFAAKIWLDTNDEPWIVVECGPRSYIAHFDPAAEKFSEPILLPETRTRFSYLFISSVVVGAKGEFWLGSTQGLHGYSPATKSWKSYKNIPGNKQSLSSDVIFSVCNDPLQPEKFLWVGTNGDGLNKLDIASGTFTRFTEKQGLPNNVIYGILGDKSGNIWLSTNYGLCRFNTKTNQCKNYFASDGLQGNEFNRYQFYKSRNGALFFIGVNGMNFFYPEELNTNDHPPAITFTNFRLFNSNVSFRDSGAVISKPLDFLDEVVLNYDQDVITVEFAAMDFAASDKNQFKYKLEGFDKDWTYAGPRREAIYTGLVPGEYKLMVMAANSEGVWSKEARTINFTVLPPWWQTWWARTLFILLGAGAVVAFILIRTASLRHNQKVLEEKVKERTRELNDSVLHLEQTQKQLIKNEKLASFGQLTAGIAHEIKNPLNFINNFSELCGEMVEELRAAKTQEERDEILDNLKNFLGKINFHGSRVDSIIKSMLNHSRAGVKKQPTDINRLCEEFANLAYHSMRANVPDFSCALKKQLDKDLPQLEVIPQDISRVLLNLLNNAFYAVNEKRKTAGPDFAPELSMTTSREDGMAKISIRDNGSGIPPEVMERLFDPFFTTKPSGEGTGLGLSISYDIIHSHGGHIQVDSKPGEFTEFVIRLPLKPGE